MADTAQEKTEQPTGKKLSDAREKGQVAKSVEVNSAVMLLFGLLSLAVFGTGMMNRLSSMTISVLRSLHEVDLTTQSVHHYFVLGTMYLGMVLGPVLFALMALGVATNVAQVGFLFTFEPLMPKFSKLNPITGVQKVMLSKRSLVELLKGIVKMLIVGIVAYIAIEKLIQESVELMDSEPAAIMGFIVRSSFVVGLKICAAFLVVALFDYAFQRFDFMQQQRMTKEEVKEENKQSEGDPMVKSRIRSIQRQLARRRMMQDVPKADVIITNPTHYAVALQYDPAKSGAPVVVAKGMNVIAQKIKEIARENNVPIMEDKPLARALYKSVEIGDQIPESLFKAVAEILAYIFQVRNNSRRA
ncbi:MAG TPA: flagellar biosynthesis protein FlhB [Bacteroidota bacterium]|nr:flagellar biosynthesis protein FlhB [Bacteroidota bacterium]